MCVLGLGINQWSTLLWFKTEEISGKLSHLIFLEYIIRTPGFICSPIGSQAF